MSRSVKVVVRIRPEDGVHNGLEIQAGANTICCGGELFHFDHVLGPKSTQLQVINSIQFLKKHPCNMQYANALPLFIEVLTTPPLFFLSITHD
jgi:hypothetical protein